MKTQKGFTLVELIVVIGILGILAGVLMGTLSGGTASAREARCLTNLRNLAAACQTYGMARGIYPHAGSVEYITVSESRKISNAQTVYHEDPGWISWYSQGKYRSSPSTSVASSGWNCSMYDTDDESRIYCLTNGCLWQYLGGNHQTYICPAHEKAKPALKPNWSYVMNAYFGWTPSPGDNKYIYTEAGCRGGQYLRDFERAERFLLFAEIPFADIGVTSKESTGSGIDCDCILQYNGCEGSSGTESVGFNHKVGKQTYGNVVFADGHVEKLVWPRDGLTEGEMQDLTAWLCEGKDVRFDGKKYTEFDN